MSNVNTTTPITQKLKAEIQELRKENQLLLAQLSFHKKIFKEMNDSLTVAAGVQRQLNSDVALQKLLRDNDNLKNQLKIYRLSAREREILRLISRGFTSKEIAGQLDISKLTVDTHRKNIQSKLKVSNSAEMIRMASSCDWD